MSRQCIEKKSCPLCGAPAPLGNGRGAGGAGGGITQQDAAQADFLAQCGLAIIRAMAIKDVLALLDAEIAALKEARQLLMADSTGSAPRKAGRPRKIENALPTVVTKTAKTKKKRNLSPEGRARIAEAAKLRWAALRKTAK